jgi:hypothetical protein
MTAMRLSFWAGILCALALLVYNAAVIARTLARSSTGAAAPEDSVAGRIGNDVLHFTSQEQLQQ